MPLSTSPRFRHPAIHSWYTSVMAFPDHLVDSILNSFSPSEGSVFFDPHCGSGTALIEAQNRGMKAFGVDANPSSVLASRVKTNWSIDLSRVRTLIELMNRELENLEVPGDDPIISYLKNSGMIERGWITDTIATRAIAIKRWIDNTISSGPIYRFFMLALISGIVRDLSNVKFGPELYCVAAPDEPPDVSRSIVARLNGMIDDLDTCDVPTTTARVRLGDSRDGRTIRTAADWSCGPAFIVTSPPYPTEHDYTRNSRLELVFMGAVSDVGSLRRIKKKMIRSHSKGIYVSDRDAELVSGFEPVQRIKREIEERIENTSSGFEGQYPKVVANTLEECYGILARCPVTCRLAAGSPMLWVTRLHIRESTSRRRKFWLR